MEIKERVQEGIKIVELKGSLDGEGAKKLDGRLKELFAFESRLLVNCKNLEYISSLGIRSIMTASRILHNRFVLCELLDRVRDVFEVSGLMRHLPMYASEREALEALKKFP
ncbi:MAG: STAS domain-containing protein [Candidatus Eremiobacteraeota bacterium]|nr:STAS domain-containing protein [Candidatus Eremiobacteraeota bacterium]